MMTHQPHNLQLIHRVEHGIMRLPVCTVPGQHAQHGFDAVAAQIAHGLGAGAEDGLHRRVQKQGIVIYAADLAFDGQDVVFHFEGREGVCIGETTADGHDLVSPVGLSINHGKLSHFRSPWRSLGIVYRKNAVFAMEDFSWYDGKKKGVAVCWRRWERFLTLGWTDMTNTC